MKIGIKLLRNKFENFFTTYLEKKINAGQYHDIEPNFCIKFHKIGSEFNFCDYI